MDPKLPLYHRIENDLKNKIFLGHYKPGDIFPSERELMEIYKVSRLTAREAVKRLEMQGLVKKIQGKGTFVTKPRIDHKVGHLYSDGEKILTSFYEIKTKVLDLRIIEPDKIIKKTLGLKGGHPKVAFLERLRYANNTPAAIIRSYLPYSYVPGIEKIDFTNKSLYKTLYETYRIILYEADEIIEAVKADSRSAKLLEVEENTPLLFNQRITYLIDGTVIEFETIEARSDVYKYHNKLTGQTQE